MELIYIYIKNYRTFQEQEIHLTDKFHVTLDDNGLKIVNNDKHCKMFQDNISNINVIVGKNASGKTSLMELVGNKVTTRFEIGEQIPMMVRSPIESIHLEFTATLEQNFNLLSDYFFIFYNGTDHNGEDLFIMEGNNPDIANNFLNNGDAFKDYHYNNEKRWFLYGFILDVGGKAISPKIDVAEKSTETRKKSLVILFQKSKAEKSDKKDESKIMIPRRRVNLDAYAMKKKVNFLISNMQKEKKELYAEQTYQLVCNFSEYLNIEILDTDLSPLRSELFRKLMELPLSEQFIIAYFYHFYSLIYKNPTLPMVRENSSLPLNEMLPCEEKVTYSLVKEKIWKEIDKITFENHPNKENFDKVKQNLYQVVNALEVFFSKASLKGEENSKINVEYDVKYLNIIAYFEKCSQIDELNDFFRFVVDERVVKEVSEEYPLGYKYLDPEILYLSEGEKNNLSLFTAIDEQITTFAIEKKHYILLLDEVEQSMHPEMCRTFLNNLMKFLKNYPDKTFQIIISSHSPFLISDLPQSSVIRLEKKEGKTTVLTATEQTFGQNIHTILKSDFFLEQTSGEYANRLVKEIANYLRSGSKQSAEEFLLENFNISLESGKGKDFISYVIGEIGEPILRSALEKMYQKWSGNSATLEERISKLEAELERLKKEGT